MKDLKSYIQEEINEGFKIGKTKAKEYNNTPINSVDDFARELSKEFGIKVKQLKGYDSTKEFGNWGDYGAKTIAKNCYELFVPNELQEKPTPVKLQFGIVDYVTKDWMKKQIKEGEMIMRTCKKESTLSGKETFKWRNNALESIPFGETLDAYIEHIKSKVNGPNA